MRSFRKQGDAFRSPLALRCAAPTMACPLRRAPCPFPASQMPEGVPPLFRALLQGQDAAALALLGIADPEGPPPALPPAAAVEAAKAALPGGFTSLHAAALGGCPSAACLLVAAGAAVDARLGKQYQLWGTSSLVRDLYPGGPLAPLLHEESTPLCCAAQMLKVIRACIWCLGACASKWCVSIPAATAHAQPRC